MSELGPNMRALLDRAREGMSPDAAALQRVRTKVGASIAAGGTATGMSLAAKLLISLVATGAIVGGVVAVSASSSTIEQTPQLTVQLHADEDVPAPAIAQAVSEPSPPPALPAPTAAPAPAPAPQPAPPASRPSPPPPAPSPRATLAREVELVDTAMGQLRRGDYATALATIHTYDTETAGRGQLAEDAAAIDVEAECRSQSSTAAARFDAFDRAWPLSAQRARLVEACK